MRTMTISSDKPDSAALHEHAHHEQQLRNAVADVAAAIAHAVGTPLNVISGRAELIRQDPSSVLAQVTRIEEQVNKLATGLRQIVDYLATPELPVEEVTISRLAEEVRARVRAALETRGIELEVDATGAESVLVDRSRVLDALATLVSWAAKCSAVNSKGGRVRLRASTTDGMVTFELAVPELEFIQGWRLEHFAARPPATATTEPYRMLSICAAMARGRGDQLLVDAGPDGVGVNVRLRSDALGGG